MKSLHWCAALGLLLLAACGGRRSPADMEGYLTPLTVEPPPIYAIIGARTDLALTSEQVAALDSIAMMVQSTNRPLIEELQAVSPPARTGMRRITEEGEPILEAIRANGREATEGVYALLTEDQRAEVCTLFERPTPGGRRGPGAPAPSDTGESNRPGAEPRWYWCTPPGPDANPGQAGAAQASSA